MKNMLIVGLTLAMPLILASSEKKSINVKAVASRSHTNEFTTISTTPEKSDTQCSGSGSGTGTTWGGSTQTSIDTSTTCRTTTTPAQTHTQTYATIDVVNKVEADGMIYTISCTAGWAGSNCGGLVDGDTFPAEIDDKTMWVYVRKGGNQSKVVKAKFKILDIRPSLEPHETQIETPVPEPAVIAAVSNSVLGQAQVDVSAPSPAHQAAAVLTNKDVVEMIRAGLTVEIVVAKIKASTCTFDTSPEALKQMKTDGLPDTVILAMVQAPAPNTTIETPTPTGEIGYANCDGLTYLDLWSPEGKPLNSTVACGEQLRVLGEASVAGYKTIRTKNNVEGIVPDRNISTSPTKAAALVFTAPSR